MSQSVISVVGLTKVFRDFWHRARVRAVNNVDLSIEPGEIYGLLGPNGSGKSTTIKIILGLLYPTRGRVAVFNRPPDDVRIKSRVGFLPEESYLYRFLNARETLDYYGTLFQIHRSERRKRTEELLDMVGLRGAAARRPVGEYSKGMARRIGLAQALINDPDLLILDEPTSGLDPIGAKLVKDTIVRIGQVYRKTILLSSHLLADVEEVCHRVTILYGGQVQVTGTMEEVLSRRDRIEIGCDRLAPETLREIEQLVQEREGKPIEIRTPRDRLENLFLRIVEQADARRVESSGAATAGEIAGFLGAQTEGRAVIDALTRGEPQVSTERIGDAATVPESPAERVDADVLSGLTESKPAVPPPAAPTQPAATQPPRPQPQVDRDLLDNLLGDEPDKDRS